MSTQQDEGATPLHFAAKEGRTETVNLLLDRGADVNAKTENGETPLIAATNKGHTDIVQLLSTGGPT